MVDNGGGSSELTASEGVWQQSRDNPTLPDQCGIDVALLLDLSASVGSSGLPQLKAAADTFADALVGTPSQMAVFSFDADSPSTSVAQDFPDLVPVTTPAGAATFKAQYAGWTLGSGTNWDAGLWAVANAAPAYEVVVVITDGNPTSYSSNPPISDGSATRLREVENGVFSANAVKAEGARVLAVGVGQGVQGPTGLNLRSISGPVLFDGSNVTDADYFQTADFASAGEALRDLALAHCEERVAVTKMIVPPGNAGEDVTGAVPAGPGWQFDASTTTPGVTGLPATATTPDDGTGTVGFDVGFPAGLESADVTVDETQQDGHTLVTQGGDNAVCVNRTSADDPVPITANEGDGFTIDLAAGAFVACTVYNRPAATLTLVKEVEGGDAVPGDWTLAADGATDLSGTSGSADVTDVSVAPGDYDLSESGGPGQYVDGDWECTVDGGPLAVEDATVTVSSGQAVVCTVTNTFSPAQVTVEKQWVINGQEYAHDERPDGFDATATLTGPDGAEATPQPWDDPREGYTVGDEVSVGESAVTVPEERCEEPVPSVTAVDGDPVAEPAALPYDVTLAGPATTVTVTNTVECHPHLTLVKVVDTTGGGTAEPDDWTLSASGPTDLSGTSGSREVTAATVDPGDYTLAESGGPVGYEASDWQCEADGEPREVVGATVAIADPEIVVCTITNTFQPASVVVEKRWVVDGTAYDHADRPDGLDATATLTGPGAAGASAQPWGEPRSAYGVGETVTLDEDAAVDRAGCTLTQARVTAVDGEQADAALPYTQELATPATEIVVTNTVECEETPPTTSPPTTSPTTAPGAGGDAGGGGTGGLPATGAAAGLLALLVLGAAAVTGGAALLRGAGRRRRGTADG
ncbi:hypothetical protein [Mumia sp. DW29H23]|uniref:hypothetical protein n=1 Tax=Mumia sp. DW29H23 TaxID=3421241 RepID=UPI003D68A676